MIFLIYILVLRVIVMNDPLSLWEAKKMTIDNFNVLLAWLKQCVDDGLIDLGDEYYNEILNLLDQADLAKTPAELTEVITLGKILETDIDAWLVYHGRTSIALSWPTHIYTERD
ncbi:MAG: hypothetical protein RL235_900 [Chlamydiota bacterium]|jgi:hypothetical protein